MTFILVSISIRSTNIARIRRTVIHFSTDALSFRITTTSMFAVLQRTEAFDESCYKNIVLNSDNTVFLLKSVYVFVKRTLIPLTTCSVSSHFDSFCSPARSSLEQALVLVRASVRSADFLYSCRTICWILTLASCPAITFNHAFRITVAYYPRASI
jgi:hypothetical protein